MKSYESLPILLAFEHSEVDGSLTLVIFYVHVFQDSYQLLSCWLARFCNTKNHMFEKAQRSYPFDITNMIQSNNELEA